MGCKRGDVTAVLFQFQLLIAMVHIQVRKYCGTIVFMYDIIKSCVGITVCSRGMALLASLMSTFNRISFTNRFGVITTGDTQLYFVDYVIGYKGVFTRENPPPARVSHWDDSVLISYRVYMMTGSFHILLFNGTFHVDKIHVWFKIANITHALTRSSLPADRFHTEMGGRFAFT